MTVQASYPVGLPRRARAPSERSLRRWLRLRGVLGANARQRQPDDQLPRAEDAEEQDQDDHDGEAAERLRPTGEEGAARRDEAGVRGRRDDDAHQPIRELDVVVALMGFAHAPG